MIRVGLLTCLAFALSAAPAHGSYNIFLGVTNLHAQGDSASDVVVVKTDPADATDLVIDVGDDGTFEGDFDKSQFSTVSITTGGGHDEVDIQSGTESETVSLLGGSGNNVLSGGPGVDTIDGAFGNDTITTHAGNENVSLGAGDDTFIWSPGDGNDTAQGDAGDDSAFFAANNGADQINLDPAASPIQHLVTLNSPGSLGLGNIEHLQIDALGGNDNVDLADTLGDPLEGVVVFGGPGTDDLDGSNLVDILFGGPAQDEIHGDGGNDFFFWEVGDGTDHNVGDAGTDQLRVTGSSAAEQFTFQRAGPFLRLTRDLDVQDTETVERFRVRGMGGDDLMQPLGTLTTELDFVLEGGDGADQLTGASLDDLLFGGAGNDTLDGRDGNDELHGDDGIDSLTGAAGADKFFCGGFGDTLDAFPDDTVDADCLAPSVPAATAAPDEPTATGNGGSQASALPPGFLGFAPPSVRGTAARLRVTVRNTHTDAIQVRLTGSETIPGNRAQRSVRFRQKTATIPAGATRTLVLTTPRRLRTALERRLRRTGKVIRKPRLVLQNTATTGRSNLRPKITLKRRRR